MAKIGSVVGPCFLGRKVCDITIPAAESMVVGDYMVLTDPPRQWRKAQDDDDILVAMCPHNVDAGDMITIPLFERDRVGD